MATGHESADPSGPDDFALSERCRKTIDWLDQEAAEEEEERLYIEELTYGEDSYWP